MIRAARRKTQATGSILLYAFDKVSALGPPVCSSDFSNQTVKLSLPTDAMSYTFRNAAEQHLASRAPAGFYGNRFSTFSKGVALMRASSGIGKSFGYDCATRASHRIKPVFHSHPGFALLQELSDRGDAPCPEREHEETALHAAVARARLQ